MNPLKKGYHFSIRLLRGAIRQAGFEVARRKDYYSVLPSVADLAEHRQRWDRPSRLVGVNYDLENMRGLLTQIIGDYHGEYSALPPWSEACNLGYGPGFTEIDGLTLYLMVRHLKPSRFFEIGSGISTWYITEALKKNEAEGFPCHLVAIDPYARKSVHELHGIEVIDEPVQDLDVDYFRQLGEGDVLFIDSTHVVKLDGDVPHLYLEVLPRLNPGVWAHSHDIHFPYNVPYPAEEYVFKAKWPRFWTEAMLLQAFLSGNSQYEIALATPMLRFFDEDFLRLNLPNYRPVKSSDYDTHFGSVWYRRKPE